MNTTISILLSIFIIFSDSNKKNNYIKIMSDNEMNQSIAELQSQYNTDKNKAIEMIYKFISENDDDIKEAINYFEKLKASKIIVKGLVSKYEVWVLRDKYRQIESSKCLQRLEDKSILPEIIKAIEDNNISFSCDGSTCKGPRLFMKELLILLGKLVGKNYGNIEPYDQSEISKIINEEKKSMLKN